MFTFCDHFSVTVYHGCSLAAVQGDEFDILNHTLIGQPAEKKIEQITDVDGDSLVWREPYGLN